MYVQILGLFYAHNDHKNDHAIKPIQCTKYCADKTETMNTSKATHTFSKRIPHRKIYIVAGQIIKPIS